MATSVELRWKIIFTWKECQNISKTSRVCHVTKKVAPKWISGFKSTKTVDDKANTGRPRVMYTEAKRRSYHMFAVWRAQGS